MTTIEQCPDTPHVVSDLVVRQPDNLPMCDVTDFVDVPAATVRVFYEKDIRINNRVVSASFDNVPIGSIIVVGLSRYTSGFRYLVADTFEATMKHRQAVSYVAMQERCDDLRQKAEADVQDLSKFCGYRVDAVARARQLVRQKQIEVQRDVAIHEAFSFTQDLFQKLHEQETHVESKFKALPYVGFDPRQALAGKKRSAKRH
jgi:altronate dehydratase